MRLQVYSKIYEQLADAQLLPVNAQISVDAAVRQLNRFFDDEKSTKIAPILMLVDEVRSSFPLTTA